MKIKKRHINQFYKYVVDVDVTSIKDCQSWNYLLYTNNPTIALFKISTVLERIPKLRRRK